MTAHRPRFTDTVTSQRVPVFHHTELNIVKAWYMEPAACGECGTEEPVLCAPCFVLQEQDAAYFDLLDGSGAVVQAKIAWTYPQPFDFASELNGLVAFYADQVTIEEAPIGN